MISRLFILLMLFLPIDCAIDLGLWELFDSDVRHIAINGQRMAKVGAAGLNANGDYPVYHWSDTSHSFEIDLSPTISGIRVAMSSTGLLLLNTAWDVKEFIYSISSWTKHSFTAMDLKVSSNDHIFFIGDPFSFIDLDYTIYLWDENLGDKVEVPGGATKVGVTSNGSLWVVKDDGRIGRNTLGFWTTLPKKARDIIVGSDDAPYIVTDIPNDDGFVIQRWNAVNNTWDTLPGIGGDAIALDSQNRPYIVSGGKVYRQRGYLTEFCPICYYDCSNCPDSPDKITCDTCRNTLCFSTECIHCKKGMYPSIPAGSCANCPANCADCQDSSTCLECEDNFFFYPDGTCQPTCDPPLDSTQAIGQCFGPCSDPDDFYYPDEGDCKSACNAPDTPQTLTYYKVCNKGTVEPPPPPTETPETPEYPTETPETPPPPAETPEPPSLPISSEEIVTVTQASTNTATHISNAISPGSIRGVSAGIAGKIFTYIKYLNITYSDELENAIQTWRSDILPFELGITISNSLENSIDEQQDVPYNFAKRDTPASFLLNYWDDLVFFLLVLGAYLLVWVVHKGAAKTQPKYLPPSLTRKLCILIQNYLLTQLFTTFGDIVFFAVLDLRSMSLASGASVFSLILILVLFLIIIMSLGLYFWLLVKYQRIKEKDAELQKFLEDHQGQQLFYNDFKDSSLIHQVVLFVMVAKDIVFSLIITTLFEHPIVQVMLILTLNFAVIAYYLIKRPFKNNFEAIQQLIYEVIIFIVTIDVTILAFMDDSYTIAFGTRNNIGKFIIILNFIFNFIALLFLLAKIGEVIWEAYKHYKSKRKTHPETIKPKVFADSSISNSIDVNTELQFLNPSKAKVRRGLNERKSLNKKYVFSSVNAMDSQLYSHRTGRPLRDNSSSEDLDKFDESKIIVTDLQAHVSNHESKFTPSFSFNKSRNAGNFQLMQDQASNDEPKITLRPFTFKNVEDNSTTKMLSRKLSSYLYPEETSKMNFSLRTELSSWEKNKIKRLTGTFVRNYKEKNSKAAGAQFNEM